MADFRIGDWQVQSSRNRLVRGQERVTVQPKVMAALELLARNPGATVDRDTFLGELWPGQIVTEGSLYQTIAALRKALGDTSEPRRYVEKVTGKGYRLLPDVVPDSGPSPKRARVPIAGVLIVAVSLALLWLLWIARIPGDDPIPAAEAVRSVVVEPFLTVDVGGGPAWEAGFSQVLLNQLARVEGLRVIAGPSDRAADAALSGTIHREGQQHRIHLQLLDRARGAVLWSERFDGEADELFELQDRVSAALLALFDRPQTAPLFQVEEPEPNLFADYLLGRALWAQRTPESLEEAEQTFRSVIERAPTFASAHAALCDTFIYSTVYRDWPSDRALRECAPLLRQALALQPDLGEAMASKALLLHQQGELKAAGRLFEEATLKAPNYAFGRLWYGNFLRREGRLAEAEAQHAIALELAPHSAMVRRGLAYGLLNQGQVARARRVFSEALMLEPDYGRRPVHEVEFFDLDVDRAVAFLRWQEAYPAQYRADPNLWITTALVKLSLGNWAAFEERMTAASETPLAIRHYLLYARAVAAAEAGDLAAAEILFRERASLSRNQQQFALPWLASLARLGRTEEALALAEDHVLLLASRTVGEENLYQLMGYAALLREAGRAEEGATIAAEIDAWLNDHFDPRDLYHLEWLAARGQSEIARAHALEILEAGWLPNHNADLFSTQRMRALVLDEIEFDRLLERNRTRALATLGS